MSENKLMVISHETLAIKIGAQTRVVSVEAAAVRGGKAFQTFMASQAFASAIRKAGDGNYRAVTEIMSWGVTAGTVKTLAPTEGQLWTKGRVLMLAEKVLERKPSKSGQFSQNQMKARMAARHLLDIYGDKAPAEVVGDAQTADPLEVLAKATHEPAPL